MALEMTTCGKVFLIMLAYYIGFQCLGSYIALKMASLCRILVRYN
jgi:hypothetical protein